MINLKKLVSLGLCAIMFVSTTGTAQGATSDITNHWAKDTLLQWRNEGLLLGDIEGNYYPDATVTRAEFMAFVNRMMGYKTVSATIGHFTDVSNKKWYYNDVNYALQAGYITGTSDTTMSPEATITKEEAVAVMVRLAGIDTGKAGITILDTILDKDDISPWAVNYITAALDNELLVIDYNSLLPKERLSRAQTVVLLDRVKPRNANTAPVVDYKDWLKDGFARGDGSATSPFEIANEAQFQYFQKFVAENPVHTQKHYKLGVNIDLANAEWTPVAPNGFSGTFDGGGHIVSNLTIKADKDAYSAGLFAKLRGGTIKNLGIHNAHIEGMGVLGAITGSNINGTIEQCFVDGTVRILSTGDYIGIISGTNQGTNGQTATIRNCYTLPTQDSTLMVGTKAPTEGGAGGIVGYNNSIIDCCYSIGAQFAGIATGVLIGVYDTGSSLRSSYFNEESATTPNAIGQNKAEDEVAPKGYTTKFMKSATNYPGFDTNIWRFFVDYYPTLVVLDQR